MSCQWLLKRRDRSKEEQLEKEKKVGERQGLKGKMENMMQALEAG